MKRPLPALLVGLLLGALAFGLVYWLQTRTHRSLRREPSAELAWLRHEFQLSPAEFARVVELHQNYRPTCAELCRRIEEQNRRLQDAVLATNAMTPEIRQLVTETGQARDACRQAMLTHLYAVAREMPPEQGRRYLALMIDSTCVLEAVRPLDANHLRHPHAGHE